MIEYEDKLYDDLIEIFDDDIIIGSNLLILKDTPFIIRVTYDWEPIQSSLKGTGYSRCKLMISYSKLPYSINYSPLRSELDKIKSFIKELSLENLLSDKDLPRRLKFKLIFNLDKVM